MVSGSKPLLPRGEIGAGAGFCQRLGGIDGAGRRPGAAAGDPPHGLQAPPESPVLADRPLGVAAAGGLEPAVDPESRHPGRESRLVEVDRAQEELRRELVLGRAGAIDSEDDEKDEQDDERPEPAFAAGGPIFRGHHGRVPVARRPSQRAQRTAALARTMASIGSRRRGSRPEITAPQASQPRTNSVARKGARGWSVTASAHSPLARWANARVRPQPGQGRWNSRRERQNAVRGSASGTQTWRMASPARPTR